MAKKEYREEQKQFEPEEKDFANAKPKQKHSFDTWWLLESHKRKLPEKLKIALEIHFKARGFMDSGDFEAGLKDFGF